MIVFRPTVVGRSTTSPAAAGRWAGGSGRFCPVRSTGSSTTATRTCWRSPPPTCLPGRRRGRRHRRDPSVRRHAARPGRARGRDSRDRVRAARPADRGELASVVERVGGAGCPLLITLSVTGRVRLEQPTRSTPRGGRVQRPPAPPDGRSAACSAPMPPRRVDGFRRLGAGSRPAEPVAARRRRADSSRSGSPAGSVPPVSRRAGRPPAPISIDAGV